FHPASRRGCTMDQAYFSALAALAGSTIGGMTSLVTSWLTQHAQSRAQQLGHDLGRREDLYRVTGKTMTIHSQRERPASAYAGVQHRGWWFYIANDDQSSKATFSLVNILFSLQAESGKGRSPLLTLPVGR